MLVAKFLQLWNRLFKGAPSVSAFNFELEQRNRELVEQKKRELGFNYAHHPKNFVTRKDGLVYSRNKINRIVSHLVLVRAYQDRRDR